MNGRLLTFVLLVSSPVITWANSSDSNPGATRVEIDYQQQPPEQLTYAQAPRLDQVVTRATKLYQLSTLRISWTNAALFDLSTPYRYKSRVLLTLAAQESFAPKALKPYWRTLREQLRRMTFARRVFTPLDPDRIRIDAQVNPRLYGHWELRFDTAPKSVYVYGAVRHPGLLPWQPRQSAQTYVKSADPLDSDLSEISVIQPDGLVQTQTIAYWNRNFQDIAPGAILYVPLPVRTSLLRLKTDQQTANHLVIELLRNRFSI
jgi:hypothetical protein